MRKVLTLAAASLLLTACSYDRQLGCTLDKLHLNGDVRQVETLVETAVPMTEMLADMYDPAHALTTMCGNVSLTFDRNGNIRQYEGYGIDGDRLFRVRSFPSANERTLLPAVVGMPSASSWDDVSMTKDDSGRVVGARYVTDGHPVWTMKMEYDDDGLVSSIVKRYDEMTVMVGQTVVEQTDTTRFIYSDYDSQHNWTRATILYTGIQPRHNDTCRVIRRITYDGEKPAGALHDRLREPRPAESFATCPFETVRLAEYGTMQVPSFMRISEDDRQEANRASGGQADYLCAFTYKDESAYASIIVYTTSDETFPDLDALTESDLTFDPEADRQLQDAMSRQMDKAGMRLLKWMHYSLPVIGQHRAMAYRMYRYGQGSPIPVIVECHVRRVSPDRTMTVLCSYQCNRPDLFSSAFRHTLNSVTTD